MNHTNKDTKMILERSLVLNHHKVNLIQEQLQLLIQNLREYKNQLLKKKMMKSMKRICKMIEDNKSII